MRIAIDARFFGPVGTGLGTYTQNLIENLEKIDTENLYFIILNTDNFKLYNPKVTNFQKVKVDLAYYSVDEQLVLPRVLAKLRPDLVHFCHFNVPLWYGGRFVVTIHDLIKHEFAGLASTTRLPLIYWLKHAAYKMVIGRAMAKSAKILVPSNWVKKRILEEFKVNAGKIVVTYEAAEAIFEARLPGKVTDEEALLNKYGLKMPFIVYVGNLYPYKNLEVVLKALKIIRSQNPNLSLQLLVSSARGVFLKRFESLVRAYNLDDLVIIGGYIPNEELSLIFKKALAYVFPSLSEGFGIPGLNAMAAGLPVIASDIPVFREIYGEAALFFDPHSPVALVEKIQLLLGNKSIKQKIIETGFRQAGQFSWRKMAQSTWEVYQNTCQLTPQ